MKTKDFLGDSWVSLSCCATPDLRPSPCCVMVVPPFPSGCLETVLVSPQVTRWVAVWKLKFTFIFPSSLPHFVELTFSVGIAMLICLEAYPVCFPFFHSFFLWNLRCSGYYILCLHWVVEYKWLFLNALSGTFPAKDIPRRICLMPRDLPRVTVCMFAEAQVIPCQSWDVGEGKLEEGMCPYVCVISPLWGLTDKQNWRDVISHPFLWKGQEIDLGQQNSMSHWKYLPGMSGCGSAFLWIYSFLMQLITI